MKCMLCMHSIRTRYVTADDHVLSVLSVDIEFDKPKTNQNQFYIFHSIRRKIENKKLLVKRPPVFICALLLLILTFFVRHLIFGLYIVRALNG
jgi:hypothetical protein